MGISLSEAEASVAAPFTSKIPNITCVPTIIKEGRCALVTSFGVFKYMALYSMVQFISVLVLYTLHTNLSDNQFLYIDLAITTTVAILMGWTGPCQAGLVAQRPPGSLISGPNLFSIFSQILLSLVVQVGAYRYLTTMDWYVRVHPSSPEEEVVVCYETTTIFAVSAFQVRFDVRLYFCATFAWFLDSFAIWKFTFLSTLRQMPQTIKNIPRCLPQIVTLPKFWYHLV